MDCNPTATWKEFPFRPPAACSVEADGASDLKDAGLRYGRRFSLGFRPV